MTSVVERRLKEIREWQDDLREQIDRMPVGSPEREGKINMLFVLHDEANELLSASQT